jgi:hypothetical protein
LKFARQKYFPPLLMRKEPLFAFQPQVSFSVLLQWNVIT